ncbi:MFS transporter [Sulfitobacter sp. MF3-043]|uniref:MFS transporter n=1 Tax=Sulfitobacter sediminivivens TaxID=3252902 RepID=UPI0036DE4EDB
MTTSPFARFVAASGLTNLADGIATVAWAWLASLLTRDPLLIALVAVALRLPWFFFAIPAGVITDRVDRRLLILRMDLLRGVAFAFAAFAIWAAVPLAPPTTALTQPGLYIAILSAATIVGIAEVFRDNAAQTMLPALVPQDRLEKANGRLWSVELVGNALIGPALGAFLIAAALPLPFAVGALAYVAAVFLVLGIAGQFQPAPTQTRNWRRELKEGFQFLWGAQLLRSLAWITGVWNLLFQMVMIALVLHVQENLGLDARAYGLILAAGALGGIAGGWWGDAIITRLGPKRTAQWMLLASFPAFLGIAYAPGPIALAVVLAAFEFTGLVWNTVSVSYRQRKIPDALLGRVNSLYRLLAWGMMPVGLLLSGLIVRIAEGTLARDTALTAPFLMAAVGALTLALAGWRALDRGFDAD